MNANLACAGWHGFMPCICIHHVLNYGQQAAIGTYKRDTMNWKPWLTVS